VPSLEEQAQELIQSSLSDAEALLSEHRYRQAVQELLWLLETVSTAFQGLDAGRGTVQGKYFNKIVGDLRRYRPGTTLDQVLSWMTTLHGYLSSPTLSAVNGHSLRFKYSATASSTVASVDRARPSWGQYFSK
jgi:hypothetical protein